MGGGANCSIYGCSTSRKNKDVGIFRLPAVKDDLSKKWREELLNVILRDRVWMRVSNDKSRRILYTFASFISKKMIYIIVSFLSFFL